MKVKLLRRYSGALTNEHKLQVGVHDLDELLARYLVANGHAEYVETEDLPQAVAEDDADETQLTRREIMALLDEAGIPYNPRDNRSTLLDLLERGNG